MTPFLKTEDLVAHHLNSVSPSLSIFYKEDRVVELLRRGEDIAEHLMKERDLLENSFRDDIAKMRQEVMEELELIRQDAYKEGLKKAREDMQKEFATVLDFVAQSRQNIEEKYKQLFQESEEEMVDLCLTVAEKLVQSELKENRALFTQILRALLKQITDQKRVIMHVSPRDYELIQSEMDSLRRELGHVKEFNVEKNSAITEGGVVFDMESGVLDAQLPSQIELIRRSLQDG